MSDTQNQYPPCSATCYSHVTHPCEKCGRLRGIPKPTWVELEAENAELRKLVEQLKCCGNCQYYNAKFEICEHPDNSEDAVLNDRCELWESATGVNVGAAERGGGNEA
jgi:hypothetical protein